MDILVYGCGVLGSLIGYRLGCAGYRVTYLARGERLAFLRERGLVLEDLVTGQRAATPVQVVDRLEPGERYDLALVVMGYHQVPEALPPLAANRHIPTVLFLGNNAAGPLEMITRLGGERVMLGFPLAGGTLREGVVYYAAESAGRTPRLVLGELDGDFSARALELARVFTAAGFEVELSAEIDAWLKSHAAMILPIAGAYYGAGQDAQRLSRTRDLIVLALRAVQEGFAVLEARGVPVLPARSRRALRWLPEPLLVWIYARLVASQPFGYALAHAGHARAEMRDLAVHFMVLAAGTRVRTPALDSICALLDPAIPPIPDGSRSLALRWQKTAAASFLALALACLAGWWLLRRGNA